MKAFLILVCCMMLKMEYCFAKRTQEATYRCSANSTDTSLLHFTFRLLSKTDTVIQLFAYDASSTVVATGKKDSCKSTSGNGTDENPFELTITVDTDDSTSKTNQKSLCGVHEVQTGRIFKFRIRSVGDLDLDLGTDAYYDCECDTNNLLTVWKSAGPIYTLDIKTVELQRNHMGAFLRVIDSSTNLPVSTVELGAEVYLQVLYNPKTNDENSYDTSGKEFWVTFLELGYTDTSTLRLRIVSASTVNAKITIWKSDLEQIVQYVIVNPLSEALVALPYSYFQSSTTRKGILVKSTENIYLMIESKDNEKISFSTVYPFDTLGNDYVVLAGHTSKQISIISTGDSTNVSIHSPVEINAEGQQTSPNTPVTHTLHKFQTLRVNTTDDVTGTTIQATASVAVFTGSNIIDSGILMEQIFSKRKFGSDFIISPGNGTIKCVTMESGTTTFRYRNISSNSDITAQREQHKSIEMIAHASSFFELRADKRVSCMNDESFSSFTFSSQQQWSSYYTFSIDNTKAGTISVHIVIANGTEKGLLINDNSLTDHGWGPVYSLTADSVAATYMATTYTVPASLGSPIRLYHAVTVFMAVLVYDDSTRKSATVPPGVHLSDLHITGDKSCIKSAGYQGDLVDNDCDGYVDEDGSVTEDTSQLDLKANIIENINPIGVRPIDCVAKPNSEWNDGGLTKSAIDHNGCLPTKRDANPFTPATSFKLMSMVGKYPSVHNSGSFKIPRFQNKADVFFRCLINFCFRFDDTSCSTQICKTSRRKRSSSSNQKGSANVQAQVTVTGKTTDQSKDANIESNNNTVQIICSRDTEFLLVTSVPVFVLLIALLITIILFRRVKSKLQGHTKH